MTLEQQLYAGKSSYQGADEQYREHLLSQYGTYLEMTDRISSRRQQANEYFLAINAALVALAGYGVSVMEGNKTPFFVAIGLAGIVLSYTWYRLVRSYKGMNSGKFEIIHMMEKQLPLAPYTIEWDVLGKGKDPSKYLPFTHIEMRVPWVFLALHALIVLYVLAAQWTSLW